MPRMRAEALKVCEISIHVITPVSSMKLASRFEYHPGPQYVTARIGLAPPAARDERKVPQSPRIDLDLVHGREDRNLFQVH